MQFAITMTEWMGDIITNQANKGNHTSTQWSISIELEFNDFKNKIKTER